MAITEQDRHRTYQRLEQVLGSEEATTLMEHLPPVGWADVATKRDLDHFADKFRAEWNRDMRAQLLAIMAMNGAMVAAILGFVR
ncbi:MAG TPA: hypothetical protein VEA78_09190 [Acidimicrobiales bacterium]|nr:hypothetical protein [Acidimicrobiales bacterium]